MLKPIANKKPDNDEEFITVFIKAVRENNEECLVRATKKMIKSETTAELRESRKRNLKDFTRWFRMIQNSIFERFIFYVMFMEEDDALQFLQERWHSSQEHTRAKIVEGMFDQEHHPLFDEHYGCSSLQLCVDEDKPKLVRWLLQHNFNPNRGCKMVSINPISKHRELIENKRAIISACIAGAWEIVDLLLEFGADINATAIGNTGLGESAESTVLTQLIHLNKMDCFKEVLKRGAQNNPTLINEKGIIQSFTPLVCALMRKHYQFIPELIKHFNLSLYEKSTIKNTTYSDLAFMVQFLTLDALKWVFHQSGLNILDYPEIPIWCAWFNKPVFKELQELGFNLSAIGKHEDEIQGYSALHAAIMRGHDRCVVDIISVKRELVHQVARDGVLSGMTPLYLALMRKRDNTATVLMLNGADPLQMTQRPGTSYTQFSSLATVIKHKNAALALVMAKFCKTPLAALTAQQREELAGCYYHALLDQPEVAQAIKDKFQFDSRNLKVHMSANRLPLLFLAANHADPRFFQLVYADANPIDFTISFSTGEKFTLLMHAALLNSKPIVEFLLGNNVRELPPMHSLFWLLMFRATDPEIIALIIQECKANFHINQLISDEYGHGYTALQFSIITERGHLMNTLLRAGADPQINNSLGQNAWALAYERYLFNPEAICLLLLYRCRITRAITDLILQGTLPLCAAIACNDRTTTEFLLTQHCSLDEPCVAGPHIGLTVKDLLTQRQWLDLLPSGLSCSALDESSTLSASTIDNERVYHTSSTESAMKHLFFKAEENVNPDEREKLHAILFALQVVTKVNFETSAIKLRWFRLLNCHRDQVNNLIDSSGVFAYQLGMHAVRFFSALATLAVDDPAIKKLNKLGSRLSASIRQNYPCAPVRDLSTFIQTTSSLWQKILTLLEKNEMEAIEPIVTELDAHPAVKELGQQHPLSCEDGLSRILHELQLLARVMSVHDDYICFKHNDPLKLFCQLVLVTIHQITTQIDAVTLKKTFDTLIAAQPTLIWQVKVLQSLLHQCEDISTHSDKMPSSVQLLNPDIDVSVDCARLYRVSKVIASRIVNSQIFSVLTAINGANKLLPLPNSSLECGRH